MKNLYTVIHVATEQQALENAEIAFENGSDGIFLINHAVSGRQLAEVYHAAREAYAGRWIGMNVLGLSARQAMEFLPAGADGLWTDNAAIDEHGENAGPEAWFRQFKTAHPGALYFGGVAFKYQRQVRDLEAAVQAAAGCMDVICTSGAGTGIAAELDKICRMRAGKSDIRIAIASGVTPENIGDYLPYADDFLVATGISRSFDWLDPTRVRLLAEKIHQE